jgi:hypothetical protein
LGSALLFAGIQAAAQNPIQDQIQDQMNENLQQSTQPVAEPARVTVQGEVRNAATGQPLPRALVRIEGDAGTGTLTDGEGRFEIPGVPPGPQTFRIVKPGFHDRPYATEDIGYPAEGPAHSVNVTAQMPGLVFSLTPNCVIHGRIELSTGDPAENMTVMLLKRVVRSGRGIWVPVGPARTSGDGMYRFAGLQEGVYALYTQPALESEPVGAGVNAGSGSRIARSGFPSVFYPDARDFSGAAHIQLSPGDQAEANFVLTAEPFYTITAAGVLPGPGNNPAPPGNTALIMDASGHQLPYVAQYGSATHGLQADLPNGTYVMMMQTFRRTGLIALADGPITTLLNRNDGAVSGSVEFSVEGRAIAGLTIPLGPTPTVSVVLRYLHNDVGQASSAPVASPTEMVNLTLDRAEGMPSPQGDSVTMIDSSQDSLQFTAPPGAYWLNTNLPRKGWCAGPLTGGGVNLARDPFTVLLASPVPPVELTLRDDCATLTLTLPPAMAAFGPGEEPFYTVYLVPDFDTTTFIPPMTMHPSSGATLTLDTLTPGNYHIYIFDSPVHLEYRNPAVMAALPNSGQAVTLSPGVTSALTLEVTEH